MATGNGRPPSALAGVRVVEIGEGKALAYAGKLLRDLGAEVVKVEPLGGDALRAYGPFPSDRPDPERSGLFAYLNGGKRGAVLDLEAGSGRAALGQLVGGADVLLHAFAPSEARRRRLDHEALAAEHPRLVVAAVTMFGSTGPYAEWRGYAIQAQAGSGVGIRTGDHTREPLNAPLDGTELQHGGVHAAVAVLLALLDRERSGRGQFVDVSVLEAVTVAVEGVWLPRVVYEHQALLRRGGQHFAGNGSSSILHTADGLCYVINLRDHHLETFKDVLGRPEWTADPRYANCAALRALTIEERDEFLDHVEAWTAQHRTAEIWERMRDARLPNHPVHSIGEVVESEQLRERAFLVEAPGVEPPLRVPGPPYRLSATPWLPPGPPPRLDAAPAVGWQGSPTDRRRGDQPPSEPSENQQPLSGVRVLDLTQVLAGPMLGRYLGDFGADVIIVETASRPRHMPYGVDPAQPYAWEYFYRNRRSITLDLKHPEAHALLLRLVERSDVLIENFTPRVMPRLGLGYEALAERNPRLIMASLSASGSSGPWAELMSFGPSLSALYGLKSLVGYPASEGGAPEIMDDANELDPIGATYGMLAILAALHHRDRTGEGQYIELAQGEAALCAAAEAVVEHTWNGRELGPRGNAHRVLAPHGFYPTEGDDRWIAIACGSNEEWRALARVAGREDWLADARFASAAGRRAARADLDREIAGWTAPQDAGALTEALQAAGVAALPAMHTLDVVGDPHHGHRRRHFVLPPEFPAAELLDGSAWHLAASPPRLRRPAPQIGEHNVEVLCGLLGLAEAEVRSLEATGALA